jgi:Flp pilus assembly pilin Flp
MKRIISNPRRRKQKGQAFVEYVILIAVIALAALFVLANFSDRLRAIITGVTVTLGGEADEHSNKKSLDIVKEIDADGVQE